MPHIIIKMYKGRSEEQKEEITKAVTESIIKSVKTDESTISVDIQEYDSNDWPEKVYKPDILDKMDKLNKKPGYNPFKK